MEINFEENFDLESEKKLHSSDSQLIPILKMFKYRYGYQDDCKVQYFKDVSSMNLYFDNLKNKLYQTNYKLGTCNEFELNFEINDKYSFWISKLWLVINFDNVIFI